MVYRRIITVLTVLFALSTVYFAAQIYMPYVYPVDICFSRNGVALGDEEACRQATPTLALEERSVGMEGTARTLWGIAALFRDLADECRQECLKKPDCSFYFLRSILRGDDIMYLSMPPPN